MPISRVVSLRSTGPLRLPLQRLPSGSPLLRSGCNRRWQPRALALSISSTNHQCRFQSTSPQYPGREDSSQKTVQQPKVSLKTLLWRGIVGDTKRTWHAIKSTSLREVMRKNPIEGLSVVVAVVGTLALLAYCVSLYFNYFNSPQFTRYPEPVAKALRKALYFSNHEIDPQRALKYYKQALELCDQEGLDHFSDDVMGIKIQVAAWLEKIESYQNAISVLENLLGDCKRWVEVMEKSAAEGTLPTVERNPAPKDGEPAAAVPEQPQETFWGKRTRLLGKAVSISVKLANLYSDEHVLERELAHERLIWAVETTLREMRRRVKDGLKEGEGGWMSADEVGASLEALAHSYESRSQYHLALPLWFQALRLCQEPCHIAVLMNNIATSFAEHPVLAPGDAPAHGMMEESKTWTTPAEQRMSYLEAAQRWAQNANNHASEPQGEKRTPECDRACAVSLSNLGSILAMLGRTNEAREKYEQAIAMSKRLGLDDYALEAGNRLRSLPRA
ncbi:hypothetical protein MFIFM68171_04161 [Madurella fahalii]|uniref:Uncharacterized protein n=1 Tax=Madurella fahalii TaxID=1157608 RepID=A0ABQ0G885_9PEZI